MCSVAFWSQCPIAYSNFWYLTNDVDVWNEFKYICTIDSPLHVAASSGVNSATSSSHIRVSFHQVDHLPIVFFVATKLEENTWSLTLIMASGWKSTSPSRASKNVFSALTFIQNLLNQSFPSYPITDQPLFVRLSTKGCPSTGVRGSSTCTWSGTTWKVSLLWFFENFYLFLCRILSLSFKWQMIFVSPGRVHIWRKLRCFANLIEIIRSQRVVTRRPP